MRCAINVIYLPSMAKMPEYSHRGQAGNCWPVDGIGPIDSQNYAIDGHSEIEPQNQHGFNRLAYSL